MLSETFIINAKRDGDEMKIVMKEITFKESIDIPQKQWHKFSALCSDISRAVEDAREGKVVTFRESFGESSYAIVSSDGHCCDNVVLCNEATGERIELAPRYWNRILYHLPDLTSAVPDLFEIQKQGEDVKSIREQLKSERKRRIEIEQELTLTKRLVSNVEFVQ